MAVASGLTSGILLTDGTAHAFTDEATTADVSRIRYTINDPIKRYWDDRVAVVVEKNIGGGFIAVSASDYTIEYAGGVIVFNVALPVGATVRVDGSYMHYIEAAEATGYKWSHKWKRIATTKLRDPAVRKTATLPDWSGSFENFHVIASIVNFDLDRAVFILQEEGTYDADHTHGSRFEGYGAITGLDRSAQVGDIIKDTVSAVGDGQRLYRRPT